MRVAVAVGSVLVLLSCFAWAQQQAPPPQNAVRPFIYFSAADVAKAVASVDKTRNGAPSILQYAPYRVQLEVHHVDGIPSSHEREAELYYVIDGEVTLETGGTLVNAKYIGNGNRQGTDVEGGHDQLLKKGDFAMIAEGVPHFFKITPLKQLVYLSLRLPRVVPEPPRDPPAPQ